MKNKSTKIIGILNVTPDSFSDGGRFLSEDLGEVARSMIEDGAEILDLGGESSGPGSVDVSLDEELQRVLPALEVLRGMPVSIDTWKSEVARAACERGAVMINDVTAGRGDPRIFDVAVEFNVPIVLMYSKNATVRTDRAMVEYEDVMKTVKDFLRERISVARGRGVRKIIIDPGMGAFVSGDPKWSFEILDRISELDELGCSILLGTSRKGFLGEDKLGMTLATTLQLNGKVDYLRVHDVTENLSVVGEPELFDR